MQIGIDFGGTKIEAAALDGAGNYLTRIRTSNPGDYQAAIRTVCELVAGIEAKLGESGSVGIGVPGSISPATGAMRNANSVYLNGRKFREDLSGALEREVRLANDANCLALSEAADGAAAGARVAFAIILGTGCGGGLAVNGGLIEGRNEIAGEWGHNPLPWPQPDEVPGPACWCGKHDCLETWISGTGLRRDYERHSGRSLPGEKIISLMREGETAATAAFERFLNRLGRAIATVCNIVDPDAIVLGGGLSNVSEIYQALPAIVGRYVFSDVWSARIAPAKWGDASGVRGAARLWPATTAAGKIRAQTAL